MPGFLTHYIAGQALLNAIEPQIREKIRQKPNSSSERLYNLGTQGPDIFFYYVPGHIRKRSRGVGTLMHQHDLGIFLMQMAHWSRLASESNGDRDILFAYTTGFIMHYVLDANAHPYIYAKTQNDNMRKLKNSAKHRKFETALDVTMLKLFSGEKPADYDQWTLIDAESSHMSTVAVAMSRAIATVYGRVIPSKEAYQAMRYMVAGTKFLQSKNGRRKRWMEIVEDLTIGEPLYSSMVHMQSLPVKMRNDYLNTQKDPWHAPWAESEVFTDSFIERYEAAIKEGVKMIEHLYEYVYSDLESNTLADIFGNRSLKTGLPCKTL